MVELNNEIRNFFYTVVAFLFFINLSITISNIGNETILGFLIIFSIFPSVILLIGYFSKDPRNPRNKPRDQEN